MRTGIFRVLALAVVTVLVAPGVSTAVDLYTNDFEDELPGELPLSGAPATMYRFFGPTVANNEITDPTFEVGFSHEISATGGVGGTQGYTQTVDSSPPGQVGGPGYFYAGFGSFAIFANDTQPLAGGVEGSNSAARYRLSAYVKVLGSVVSAPLIMAVSAIDGDYESVHGIDANGDGDLSDGAAVYRNIVTPALVDGADYTNINFTLDQGTIEADAGVLPEHQVFSNALSLLWQFNWGAAEFGLDAGNSVSIDNVRIEFLEDVPAVPGDYNGNGTVDAADYVVWRKNDGLMGGATAAQGDGTGDGNVTPEDYDFWRARFGNTSGAGAALSVSAAVPEPGTLSLIAVAAALVAARFSNRTRGCPSAGRH